MFIYIMCILCTRVSKMLITLFTFGARSSTVQMNCSVELWERVPWEGDLWGKGIMGAGTIVTIRTGILLRSDSGVFVCKITDWSCWSYGSHGYCCTHVLYIYIYICPPHSQDIFKSLLQTFHEN